MDPDSDPDPDADPGPAIFVSDFRNVNKKNAFFQFFVLLSATLTENIRFEHNMK
jgi:hypothetical protein